MDNHKSIKEYVFLSGKGGTGKTTITSYVASCFDQVVVVDCDVDAPNMHLIYPHKKFLSYPYASASKAFINNDKCSNCGKCIDLCSFKAISFRNGITLIDEFLCEGCMICKKVCSNEAINIVSSEIDKLCIDKTSNGYLIRAEMVSGEENSGKTVTKLREMAVEIAKKNNINTIIIDGPPGIACPVMASMTGCKYVLIVIEPTLNAFSDLKRLVDLVLQKGINAKCIINKYNLNISLSNCIQEWCKQNNIEIISKLVFSNSVLRDLITNKMESMASKNEFSTSIKKVYNYIKNQ